MINRVIRTRSGAKIPDGSHESNAGENFDFKFAGVGEAQKPLVRRMRGDS
jgi:hypothetical protein